VSVLLAPRGAEHGSERGPGVIGVEHAGDDGRGKQGGSAHRKGEEEKAMVTENGRHKACPFG
jgi:hypothetical protein